MRHTTKIRVYYADTDCGKVVYYANYLKYFEIGRTELLRANGIELEHYHSQNIIFIVVSVNIDYKFSAKYNDELTILSELIDYNKKTFTIYNEILNQDSRLCVSGQTKCACVDNTGKLITTPVEIIKVFEKIINKREVK